MKQFFAFFAILMLIGLVIQHWQVIVILLALFAMVAIIFPLTFKAGEAVQKAYKARQEKAQLKRDEHARLASRARIEHQWYLDGNTRGIYGEFPPVDLDKL